MEDDDENEGGVGFNWICCSTFQLDMLFYLFILLKNEFTFGLYGFCSKIHRLLLFRSVCLWLYVFFHWWL